MNDVCPCFAEDVRGWPHKSTEDWTDAEAKHVWNLVHGGCSVKHKRYYVEATFWHAEQWR